MVRLIAQFIFLVLSAFFLWAGGLLLFQVSLDNPPSDLNHVSADVIVVLTGGPGRLETGFQLLTEQKATELFVSGVHKDVSIDDLMARHKGIDGLIKDKISMGQESHNTTGNVLETVQWMNRRSYTTLVLVTSDYHMPRARLYFSLHAPELNLIPYPVTYGERQALEWWKNPDNMMRMVREYSKYILSYLPIKILTGLSK